MEVSAKRQVQAILRNWADIDDLQAPYDTDIKNSKL
jgi:hypothetical protein